MVLLRSRIANRNHDVGRAAAIDQRERRPFAERRGAVAQMTFPVVAALLRSVGLSFLEGIRRFTETPLHQNTQKPIWATAP